MTSINFKVIGLTQPGFENAKFGLEPTTFGFANLPKRDADALLIRPPRLCLTIAFIILLYIKRPDHTPYSYLVLRENTHIYMSVFQTWLTCTNL